MSNGSELDGHYFFADFPESGALFTFELNDALNAIVSGTEADIRPADISTVDVLFDDDDDPNTPSVATSLRDLVLNDPNTDGSNRLDVRFGQGPGGEMYLTNKHNGWIYLVANSISPDADFDGDDDVDGTDLLIWQRNAGIGSIQSEGDANGDLVIDTEDLAVWEQQFGSGAGLLAANSSTVPEPSTRLMCCLLLGCLRALRRSRS